MINGFSMHFVNANASVYYAFCKLWFLKIIMHYVYRAVINYNFHKYNSIDCNE